MFPGLCFMIDCLEHCEFKSNVWLNFQIFRPGSVFNRNVF